MFQYVHQLVANFICLLFGAGHVSLSELFHTKRLHAVGKMLMRVEFVTHKTKTVTLKIIVTFAVALYNLIIYILLSQSHMLTVVNLSVGVVVSITHILYCVSNCLSNS